MRLPIYLCLLLFAASSCKFKKTEDSQKQNISAPQFQVVDSSAWNQGSDQHVVLKEGLYKSSNDINKIERVVTGADGNMNGFLYTDSYGHAREVTCQNQTCGYKVDSVAWSFIRLSPTQYLLSSGVVGIKKPQYTWTAEPMPTVKAGLYEVSRTKQIFKVFKVTLGPFSEVTGFKYALFQENSGKTGEVLKVVCSKGDCGTVRHGSGEIEFPAAGKGVWKAPLPSPVLREGTYENYPFGRKSLQVLMNIKDVKVSDGSMTGFTYIDPAQRKFFVSCVSGECSHTDQQVRYIYAIHSPKSFEIAYGKQGEGSKINWLHK